VTVILFGDLPESFALLDFVPLRCIKAAGAAATFLFVCFWAYIGYCPWIVFLLSHKFLLSDQPLNSLASRFQASERQLIRETAFLYLVTPPGPRHALLGFS